MNTQKDEDQYNYKPDKDIIDITNIIKKSENYTSSKESDDISENQKTQLTENLYTSRRNEIEKIKKNNTLNQSHPSEFDLYNFNNKEITLFSNNQKWEYSTFDTEISKKLGSYNVSSNIEEQPKITNEKWSNADISRFSKESNLEIRNLIFRSVDFINYNIANIEIITFFSLKGESSFWIFLHCNDNIFEKESSIIQISKYEKSQKAFISLGIVLGDNFEYKVFTRQQLVSFNKEVDKNKKKEDLMEFKLIILDSGEGDSRIQIFVNQSLIENSINCDFFYPIFDNRRLFIAGSGHQCSIQSFDCKCLIKPKFGKQYTTSNQNNNIENNDCCDIF